MIKLPYQGERPRLGRGRPIIRFLSLVPLLAAVPMLSPAAVPQPKSETAAACAALSQIRLRSTEVSPGVLVPAGPMDMRGSEPAQLPEHCLVRGVIEPRTGVDGKPYGIHFELRAPLNWNGRFLFQGGGGTNGVVRPAIGDVKGPPALASGFAVVTQDAGHSQADASFGQDQQARIDMNYRSYEQVTVAAKTLIAAFYGRGPDRSYFMGCSEGGREAMLASQRMPLEYDGVVAGDPGFQLGLNMEGFWSQRILNRISPRTSTGLPDRSRAFTPEDLGVAAGLIEARCDELDGLKDGIIDNWPACRVRFRDVACPSKAGARCIAPAKAAALDEIFRGGKTPNSHVASIGLAYDRGISAPGWSSWKLGTAPDAPSRWGAVTPLGGLFMTPYQPGFDRDDYVEERDWPKLQEVGGQQSADAVSYSTFRQRKAKMILYTGASDPVFPVTYLVEWYERLKAANGGEAATEDFARLFVVPGMNHCRGGPALDDFDPLTKLVAWVERGEAPDRIVAKGSAFPGRTRPLCPYPRQSRYKGSGSIEAAENFTCEKPAAS